RGRAHARRLRPLRRHPRLIRVGLAPPALPFLPHTALPAELPQSEAQRAKPLWSLGLAGTQPAGPVRPGSGALVAGELVGVTALAAVGALVAGGALRDHFIGQGDLEGGGAPDDPLGG